MSPVEFAYLLGWRVARTVPKSFAWAVFRAGAHWVARRRGPGAQRLERNLRQVVGPDMSAEDLEVLVRDGLRSYARYWLEAFRLPKLTREQVLRDFHLENGHWLGEAVDAGTGCVVALPHAGNWDFAGAWVGAMGWKLTTVQERVKPEGVYERFVAYRAKLGMEILPARGGSRPPMDVLLERLAEANVVPLLADRDLSSRGVEVTFFGGRTRMPAGPAMLAIRTGAPLFVASLWYDGDKPRGRVDGPLPVPDPDSGPLDVRVRELTQKVADLMAVGIAEHPADWHMLQRLWISDATLSEGARMAVPPSAPPEGSRIQVPTTGGGHQAPGSG